MAMARIRIVRVERIEPGIVAINGERWRQVRARKPWKCAASGERIERGDTVYAPPDPTNPTRISASAIVGWIIGPGDFGR